MADAAAILSPGPAAYPFELCLNKPSPGFRPGCEQVLRDALDAPAAVWEYFEMRQRSPEVRVTMATQNLGLGHDRVRANPLPRIQG